MAERINHPTILCYGDSNTYGYNPRNGLRYSRSIRWPGVLSSLMESAGAWEEYAVIEEGCNGRTTIFDDPGEEWKNGRSYLKACLNSHKPIDIVVLMLGSNDLKDRFHASAEEIAKGAGVLVNDIREFTEEKQGFIPEIILISPPVIGDGIASSPFAESFSESAISRSKEFSKRYGEIAEEFGCVFLDAAEWIQSSKVDSLHLDPEAHRLLAEKVFEMINGLPEIKRES